MLNNNKQQLVNGFLAQSQYVTFCTVLSLSLILPFFGGKNKNKIVVQKGNT